MLQQITVNTKALESMLFIWASLADREKIADTFFIEFAASPEMKAAYRDGFDANSFRKVLSAIANRELLSDASQAEKRFWNNNMWMTEDLEFTKLMVEPLKTLNLDKLKEELKDFPKEKVEVVFYPGTSELAEMKGSILYVNFFKVVVDVMDPEAAPKIDGKEIPAFIREQLEVNQNA